LGTTRKQTADWNALTMLPALRAAPELGPAAKHGPQQRPAHFGRPAGPEDRIDYDGEDAANRCAPARRCSVSPATRLVAANLQVTLLSACRKRAKCK